MNIVIPRSCERRVDGGAGKREEFMRLTAVRNRDLSLWQSAVGEVAGKLIADPKLSSAMQVAAGVHAAAVAKGAAIAPPPADLEAVSAKLEASDPQTLAYVSKLVLDVARAHQSGDTHAERAAMSAMKDFVTRHYATFDFMGWMQCVWRYLE